jgi:hypothetical protein
MPGKSCIKSYNSITLPQGFCSTQTLLSIRFNAVGMCTPVQLSTFRLTLNLDLLRVNRFEALVEQFQSPSVTKSYVDISSPSCCGTPTQPYFAGALQNGFASIYQVPQSIVCTFRNRQIILVPAGRSLDPQPLMEVFIQRSSLSSHEGLTGPFRDCIMHSETLPKSIVAQTDMYSR